MELCEHSYCSGLVALHLKQYLIVFGLALITFIVSSSLSFFKEKDKSKYVFFNIMPQTGINL